MYIDFLLDKMKAEGEKDAFILNDKTYKYSDILKKYDEANQLLLENNIKPHDIVLVEGDFNPISTALLLSLAENNNVIVPATELLNEKINDYISISQADWYIKLNEDSVAFVKKTERQEDLNPLYKEFFKSDKPGLILFSSGSTGVIKAALHDFTKVLEKFKRPRKVKKMITFLMFDHMGGLNTLFHNLSNGGCVVPVKERTPDGVLSIVEKYKVEVLPVSPTFINIMLLSGVYKKYDLSSLKVVSYGTEVMPEAVLHKFTSIFPDIRLVQTYGLSELGVMDTKSESNNSLWVKLGGDGYQTRVVDGLLEIKAESAMIGYLNAPSPFTEDGWFKTMDVVEVKDDYFKILGRKSEIINIGGEKVFPAEIESFFLDMEGISDIAIKGEPNPIMGNIVVAKVKLDTDETLAEFQKRMRAFAKGKLSPFKIPQKVILVDKDEIHNIRMKKNRK